MRFSTFTSRFNDQLIQNLLGQSALKLLTAIDPALSSRTKLLELAIDLYTPVGTGWWSVREVTKIKADCKQELT